MLYNAQIYDSKERIRGFIYKFKHKKKKKNCINLSTLFIKVELNPRHAISSKTLGIKIPRPAIIIT